MIQLGTVRPGSTIYIPFATYDSNDPSASVTITGLAVTDIEVYKNGGTTQRSSDSGYALLDTDGIDFDGITGIHGISIDLSDNTDAGFWVAGAQYTIVIASITVDAATINFIAATFRIGTPGAIYDTTIASVTSQALFTLASGPADDDALNGCVVWIHDAASDVQCCAAVVQDYVGSTKTVTLSTSPTFTIAAGDNISIFPPANAHYAAGGPYSDAGVDVTKLDGNSQAALALKYSALATLYGSVAVSGSNTATTFKIEGGPGSGLGNFPDDYFGDANGGMVLIFISGAANEFQSRRVVAFDTTTDFVTVEQAFESAPSTSDAFVLLGRITELS